MASFTLPGLQPLLQEVAGLLQVLFLSVNPRGMSLTNLDISNITQFRMLCCFQNDCNNSVWQCRIKFITLLRQFRQCGFKLFPSVQLVKQPRDYCLICSYVSKGSKSPQKGQETRGGFCFLADLRKKSFTQGCQVNSI